jgi:hypothetical protein
MHALASAACVHAGALDQLAWLLLPPPPDPRARRQSLFGHAAASEGPYGYGYGLGEAAEGDEETAGERAERVWRAADALACLAR